MSSTEKNTSQILPKLKTYHVHYEKDIKATCGFEAIEKALEDIHEDPAWRLNWHEVES